MFARHCSDEQLLAHLDGELRWPARLRVGRHLNRCWHCRTRLAGLESEVHALLRRVDGAPLPADWAASARQRFFERPELEEIEFAGEERAGIPVRWRWKPVAAALAVSISAFAWWKLTLPPLPPRQATAPKVFRLPAPPAPVPEAIVLPLPPRLTVPLQFPAATSAPVDLGALELRTRYALHRADSCLGEGIEVVRIGGDRLAVRGVVQSAARREEIVLRLGLLAPSSAVQVRLRTLDELRASHVDGLPAAAPLETAESAATIAMEPLLLERYRRIYPDVSADARQRRVIDLSNQVLRLAGIALSHAWALHNFAAAYPPERLRPLSPADQTLTREMIREHTAELNAACSELAARLDGQIDGVPPQTEAVVYPTWQEAAEAALAQIRRIHADAFDLFSCCHPIADPRERAARLTRTLEETRRLSAGMNSAPLVAER